MALPLNRNAGCYLMEKVCFLIQMFHLTLIFPVIISNNLFKMPAYSEKKSNFLIGIQKYFQYIIERTENCKSELQVQNKLSFCLACYGQFRFKILFLQRNLQYNDLY